MIHVRLSDTCYCVLYQKRIIALVKQMERWERYYLNLFFYIYKFGNYMHVHVSLHPELYNNSCGYLLIM